MKICALKIPHTKNELLQLLINSFYIQTIQKVVVTKAVIMNASADNLTSTVICLHSLTPKKKNEIGVPCKFPLQVSAKVLCQMEIIKSLSVQ